MLSDELFGVSNVPVGGVDIVVVDRLDQIMVKLWRNFKLVVNISMQDTGNDNKNVPVNND